MTNPKDFEKLLKRIGREKLTDVWFFPLRSHRKNPDCPFGTVLKGNTAYRLDKGDALKRLSSGGNVGIYALQGGLMFLDLDVTNNNYLASERILARLDETLTIQTRNGGKHLYYWNDGTYANQDIKENGVKIGELRTDWFYVVSCGSFVDVDDNNTLGDGNYRIIKNVPIIDFQGFPGVVKRGTIKEKEKLFFEKTEKPVGIVGNVRDYEQRLKDRGVTPVSRIR